MTKYELIVSNNNELAYVLLMQVLEIYFKLKSLLNGQNLGKVKC